jgi:diguanylate cyclase (GGDEF)-like protein
MDMSKLRQATKWYIAVIVLAALSLLIGTLANTSLPSRERLVLVGMLTGFGVVAFSFPLQSTSGTRLSLHTSVLFAAMLLFEPGIAMLIAGGSLFLAQFAYRKPWDETFFNAAQFMLQVGAGGLILAWTGWNFDAPTFALPHWVVLIVVVAVVMYVIEFLAVAAVIGLQTRRSPLQVLRELARLDVELVSQFTLGLLGAMLANYSIWMIPLIVPPLLVIYRSNQRQAQLQRQAQDFQHQAFHDSLTGLPNRALFTDRLEHALHRAARSRHTIAVLFLDLDRFKYINDSLGHEAGDELLVAVGKRLRDCLRPEDTVARLGGDEFTVLLEDVYGLHQATTIAERIKRTLQSPFLIAGQDVFISASIGVTLSEAGQHAPGEVMRNADTAMYKAKEKGKACYQVFDAQMDSRALARLQLEADLYQAIERQEFVVYYQPQIELATGKIVCFEALVRWAHPQRGLVPPGAFIPLAEETGLILPLGQLVLRTACRQACDWLAQYSFDREFAISVNLSARQFQHPTLAEEIAQVLADIGLEPQRLRLEITESVVMHHVPSALTTLQRLKDLGVQLAIDDFGTGYSSLSYLKHFPVDTLKIDKTFVDRLNHDAADAAIVQAITTLAQTLKMHVVAEGVETTEQLKVLQMLGCELGQGFLFAKPLPSDMAGVLFANDSLIWAANEVGSV